MASREQVGVLLKELEPRIRAAAIRTRKFGRSSDDLEDACQHLRELVVRQADQFTEASPALRTFMLKAAAISRLRAERGLDSRQAKFEEAMPPSQHVSRAAPPCPEKVQEGSLALDRICTALSELTPQELRVFTDRLDGQTSRETADSLGVADDTVRYYRTRVLQKLGDAVGAEGGSSAELQALIEALHGEYESSA